MSQSLVKLWVHLIFSTKNRYPFLSDRALRLDMHAYLASMLRSNNCETTIVGGVEDHVHALFALSKNHSLANVVKEIKRTSSAWIKDMSRKCQNFHWQAGYGGFSVSQSQVEEVALYIQQQEEHHKRVTFQDEYRAFLRKYGVEFDERFVWD
ncbi:MAG TPA: IS200/IS605 family transposase [Pyrinomonadaceae bacterium]|jgi:REP element-mobilizing transposase RayT|nr:IS200/IS605 family transposase [Pyrinomonadaceae bacterium]